MKCTLKVASEWPRQFPDVCKSYMLVRCLVLLFVLQSKTCLPKKHKKRFFDVRTINLRLDIWEKLRKWGRGGCSVALLQIDFQDYCPSPIFIFMELFLFRETRTKITQQYENLKILHFSDNFSVFGTEDLPCLLDFEGFGAI